MRYYPLGRLRERAVGYVLDRIAGSAGLTAPVPERPAPALRLPRRRRVDRQLLDMDAGEFSEWFARLREARGAAPGGQLPDELAEEYRAACQALMARTSRYFREEQ